MAKKVDLLTEEQREGVRRQILKASEICGSQAELARRSGVTYQYINRMIMDGFVPAEQIVAIERAVFGKVRRHKLRPDLFKGCMIKYKDQYNV